MHKNQVARSVAAAVVAPKPRVVIEARPTAKIDSTELRNLAYRATPVEAPIAPKTAEAKGFAHTTPRPNAVPPPLVIAQGSGANRVEMATTQMSPLDLPPDVRTTARVIIATASTPAPAVVPPDVKVMTVPVEACADVQALAATVSRSDVSTPDARATARIALVVPSEAKRMSSSMKRWLYVGAAAVLAAAGTAVAYLA